MECLFLSSSSSFLNSFLIIDSSCCLYLLFGLNLHFLLLSFLLFSPRFFSLKTSFKKSLLLLLLFSFSLSFIPTSPQERKKKTSRRLVSLPPKSCSRSYTHISIKYRRRERQIHMFFCRHLSIDRSICYLLCICIHMYMCIDRYVDTTCGEHLVFFSWPGVVMIHQKKVSSRRKAKCLLCVCLYVCMCVCMCAYFFLFFCKFYQSTHISSLYVSLCRMMNDSIVLSALSLSFFIVSVSPSVCRSL